MDSVLFRLENISIGMLVATSLAVLLAVLVMPKKIGFYLSLFLMGAWLNFSRFENLVLISTSAKFTFMIPPLMLMFCSSAIPGPRRTVPLFAWVYLLCPMFGVICIAGTSDRLQGIAQFGQMFFLAAGAITLYRVTTNNQVLLRSLTAIFLGQLVPVAVGLFALVVYRSAAFRPGVNRFEPFGMLSNHYVQILASTCCLAACGYFTITKTWIKAFCLIVIGSCLVLLIVCGSRQGLVITGISLLPSLWNIRRNPIAVAFGAACCVAIAAYLFRYSESLYSEHLTDFTSTSGRSEIAMQYLDVVATRPVTGLLGTHGLSVSTLEHHTKVPHNSYLRMAYLGGAVLFVPLAAVALNTLYSCYYVILNKKRLNMNHLILSSMAALLLAIYVQGVVNDGIYLSNSTLPFMHFFFSCFFMGTAQELKRQPAYSWQYDTARSMPAMG